MKCPSCLEPDLVVTTRHGIEIDLCARCRGIWLDRGELEKIIARSDRGPELDDDEFEDHRHPQRGRGKRSWLADLFD